MRNGTEIIKLIIDIATNDDRIRAVLMNGSRANPNAIPDEYQDFDIVFIVCSLNDFTNDRSWVNVFGDIIIRQLPDEMSFGKKDHDGFAYLMILEDGNRIDLTLYPLEKITNNYWPDSLTVCLLDKDNRFETLPLPNDSDYFIKQPSAKEFSDVCNEFWWVSTYVAKGLSRNEVTYAKEMLETAIRPMFMKIIEWKIGADNDFSVSFGKAGRFMHNYVSNDFYKTVLETYSDSDIVNNWKALFIMIELFEKISNELAAKLNFRIDTMEQQNVTRYLRELYDYKK
ncbi:aminoglycoside 6-adenylyltransferase [Flavitalea sp.]|nr:aminoglycoside 6-adenylyltransferase [Flavitalea sp.]